MTYNNFLLIRVPPASSKAPSVLTQKTLHLESQTCTSCSVMMSTNFLLLIGSALFATNAYCFSLTTNTFSRQLQRCGGSSGLKEIKMKLGPDQENRLPLNRRAVLGSGAALIAGSWLNRVAPAAAKLDPRPPTPDDLLVYFGAGCFWHVQVIEKHENTPSEFRS